MPFVKPYRVGWILLFVLAVLALFRPPVKVFAHEISGFVTGEVRLFQNEALFPGQSNQSASFALQPEYYHEFESGSSFTFVPFLRVDSGDQERTHFDIRELTYLWLQEDYELRVGV